jgi:Protein phosphatase 2C
MGQADSMYLAAATEPGSDHVPNEDWAGVSPSVAVVLDGVTIPSGIASSCAHGTPWYVEHLGSQLMANAVNADISLPDALAHAITTVANSHSSTCDISQVSAPSATVAAIRLSETAVDYLVLADTTITLAHGSKIEVITDDRVASTVNDLAGRDNIGQLIMERRARYRNTEGGYWVAAADPIAATNAITGRIPRSDFRHAALMTDGVTRIVTPFQQTDWRGLLALALESGPAAVIQHVRTVESDDSLRQRWPSFKARDDATIAVIRAPGRGV